MRPMAYNPHARFYYSKLLTYLCYDYGSFRIFQSLIWMGVVIGKFLIDLGVETF